ncbi:hypothetical protein [Deferrisoma camini]|uniref:hypothetical protein n=1 Tax=Deferrisoma camini TaxID=1035120 RepID=UPI00146B0587|nr:hypothetical protein [Deferrisoma camini]
MRARWLAVAVGLWGLVLAALGRTGTGTCPLGVCAACGACFPSPRIEQPQQGDRVA